MTFVIVAFAASLAWILTCEQVPQMLVEQLLGISTNKYVILIIVNIFLLVVGMFMDVIASLIILSPDTGTGDGCPGRSSDTFWHCHHY